ncbi:MAG TPA: ribosome maturation factor RimM [Steroidobacteraceae bacterium]
MLGKVASPFGVKGWVKIVSFTDPIDNILDYSTLQLGSGDKWTPIRVEDGQVTGKGVIAKLAGIGSPELARTKTGLELGVWRSELPPPAPGQYYWSDLEGLEAVSATGEWLGRIDHFRTTPTGPVVIVQGEQEHWIPFVKDRIVKVDMEAARVVLDWSLD